MMLGRVCFASLRTMKALRSSTIWSAGDDYENFGLQCKNQQEYPDLNSQYISMIIKTGERPVPAGKPCSSG